ncbi:MAG TPA: LysR family transcriptional regulator [Gammaproteobacteria bacterium]|nr:LysR family transcriptional regulator [Luteimonas sp.]HRO27859.1 LysR family transcriptional regulator [Luteimonas sp.]HRP35823.1 LysR family transcriptional regulator [Gammaproteobacteria bacterium]HRP73760.1 LysR family transcriptional regulator [Luteimonas sp.]
MDKLDLNLLVTLDVLLDEGSVVGAAKRLQLSASAMSRSLSRLREATGDPLLVRAGRGLVPTPRALELRGRVRQVVDDAETVLRPALKLDLASLSRTFVIRSTEGFAETFGADLIARVAAEAPMVRLSFLAKLDKDSTALRDGSVDLETGVIAQAMGPEVRSHGLFRDRFVGVARRGHKLSRGRLTLERYLAAPHVLIERRGLRAAMVDEVLARIGKKRNVAATVSGFGPAIALARVSDMVATVPEKHTSGLCEGMHRFKLPVDVEEFMISLFWHPRMDADPAHRWLRSLVLVACRGAG